jgi:hypothetical protein
VNIITARYTMVTWLNPYNSYKWRRELNLGFPVSGKYAYRRFGSSMQTVIWALWRDESYGKTTEDLFINGHKSIQNLKILKSFYQQQSFKLMNTDAEASRFSLSHYLKVLRKTTKNLVRIESLQGRYINPSPPTTKFRHSTMVRTFDLRLPFNLLFQA